MSRNVFLSLKAFIGAFLSLNCLRASR